jgi:hypothetical protein
MSKKGFRPQNAGEAFGRWQAAYNSIHVPTRMECANQVGMQKLQCVLNGLISRRGAAVRATMGAAPGRY